MHGRVSRPWWRAARIVVRRGVVGALIGGAVVLVIGAGSVALPRARALLAQLQGPVADQPLVGTVWHLTRGVPGVARVPDTAVTVVFAADGQVQGRARCNEFFGRHGSDCPPRLTIHDLSKT